MKDERTYDINNDDILNIFEDVIKPGRVELEEEIVKGFKVKLRVLDTGEAVAAEAVMRYDSSIPSDLVARVRGASILSRAIVSINDVPIERDDMTKSQKEIRRASTYQQLLKLPAHVISKTYDLYVRAYDKQANLYSDLGETIEEIKNF